MKKLTFRCRKIDDDDCRIWYLFLDGKRVLGTYIIQLFDSREECYYKIRYNYVRIPPKDGLSWRYRYTNLSVAKRILVEYVNLMNDL